MKVVSSSKESESIMKLVLFPLFLATCLCQSDKDAKIVRELNNISPDGSFSYAFETENAIFAEAQGFLRNGQQVIEGQYQFTSPEGEIVRLVYTADENGFHPQGHHLPTAPPIAKNVHKV